VTRILSGILLGGVVGAAIVWAPPSVLLGIAVLFAALAAGEFVALAEAAGAPVPRTPTIVAAGALCAAVPWAGAVVAPVVIAVVLTQAALAVGWLAPDANTIARVSIAVFGPLYVGLPLGSLVAVHWSGGPAAALLLIGTIVISDTAQYYGGRLLGRRPLAPVLSPKKTVEGAVGGFLVAPLFLYFAGPYLIPVATPLMIAPLGLVLVACGIAGDLFESMIKRAADLKDSSALIPGHGGVLDRIDALLFATPPFYMFVRWVYTG